MGRTVAGISAAGLFAALLSGCAAKGELPAPTAAAKVQTEAAAGLSVSPAAAGATKVCNYDTGKGPVAITIASAGMCPIDPPGPGR